MIDAIRAKAKELLESKKVECFIGYERGSDGMRARPAFIYEPSSVDKLVFDDTCAHNLSKYLLNRKDKSTAVVVKPCDSRGINLLINENQIKRESVFIIGVVCGGLKKTSFGEVQETTSPKCQYCSVRVPVVYDYLVGEAPAVIPNQDFSDVSKVESLTATEREKLWSSHFDRCIRCYACRQVCVGCYCSECFVEELEPQWVGIRVASGENWLWNTGRAMHLSARCTDCGECERVCPVGIPLMLLNRKLQRDTSQLFGFEPGVTAEAAPLFSVFRKDEKLGIGE